MLLMGKLTISMAIFNSYVSLPEGILWMFCVLCWKLFRLIHFFLYMNSHIVHKNTFYGCFVFFFGIMLQASPSLNQQLLVTNFGYFTPYWYIVYIYIQCEAPKTIKLVYNSNNYGLWYASNYSCRGL